VLGDALDREERPRLFEEMAGSLADVQTPGRETPEAVLAWIRDIRRESDPRIDEAWADRS